jgi:hypothetical protein
MIGPDISVKFFKMIVTRKIPEAEQELEKIRGKLEKTKDDLGYVRALEGLVLTEKSGDKNLYLNRLNLDEKSVKEIHAQFIVHAANELHEEYDLGYFRALADYLKILENERIWEQNAKPTEKELENEIEKGPETSES